MILPKLNNYKDYMYWVLYRHYHIHIMLAERAEVMDHLTPTSRSPKKTFLLPTYIMGFQTTFKKHTRTH